MKKLILTLALSLIGIVVIAQSNDRPERLKYVSTAPDGSIAMTLFDDTREDTMKLESAENFYRFEILEPTTSETVYAAKNRGKECTIDKSKLTEGTYNLRLYTASFIITSKITISPSRKMKLPVRPTQDVIASLNYDY